MDSESLKARGKVKRGAEQEGKEGPGAQEGQEMKEDPLYRWALIGLVIDLASEWDFIGKDRRVRAVLREVRALEKVWEKRVRMRKRKARAAYKARKARKKKEVALEKRKALEWAREARVIARRREREMEEKRLRYGLKAGDGAVEMILGIPVRLESREEMERAPLMRVCTEKGFEGRALS